MIEFTNRARFFWTPEESIWLRYVPLPDSWKPYFWPVLIGTASGVGLPYVACAVLGLSAAGPVAGGWFAAHMGAGLKAGSLMAVTQSLEVSLPMNC